MKDGIQRELHARIESFASDITHILQKAVADSVADALGGRAARAARPPALKARASKPKRAARRGVRIEAEQLLREVVWGPDRRMEQIAKALKTSSKDLTAPMKQLLAEKKVKRSGQARGTTYRAT